MRAVGVAGTAKNTGKTTSLIALMAESAGRGLRIALTSIGFDGEPFDHLTGLPKPRIMVQVGMLVATAEGILAAATAGLEPLARTGAATALGEVVVLRVSRPGLVPIAGAPTGAGLHQVLRCVAEAGADLCLVDGAFGRMAPMVGLDGIILATGAARHRNPEVLAEETAAIGWIFDLPEITPPAGVCTVANLLTRQETNRILSRQTGNDPALQIGGMVIADALGALAETGSWSTGSLCLFPDPIRLVLAGDPRRVRQSLERLAARTRVGVARRLPLLAFTLNPFYPDDSNGAYRSALLDIGRIRGELARRLTVPVVDVVAEGAAALAQFI